MKRCRGDKGKICHPSRGKAEAHLRHLQQTSGYVSGKAYACHKCKGWHVGAIKVGYKNKYLK